MKGPKILLPDVEVSLKLGYFYDQWKTNIPAHRIKQDSFLISAAWKWYGQKTVHAVSVLSDKEQFKKDHTNDRVVVKALYDAFEEADAVVYYNGVRFDQKEFNVALARHGIGPAKNVIQIDPYQIARQYFRFSGGNSLDNLCKQLKLGVCKDKIADETWIAAAEGNRRAIQEVVRYNKNDIVPMELAWDKLKAFAPAKLNMNHFVKDSNGLPVDVCPSCGSPEFVRDGMHYTKVTAKQRYLCKGCGHRFTNGKAKGRVRMR